MKDFKTTPVVALATMGFSIAPASASSLATSGSTHTLQLPIMRDVNQYVAEIGVGRPPQRVNMTIDMGSAFTWVLAAQETNACESCSDEIGTDNCTRLHEATERYTNTTSTTYAPHPLEIFSASRNGHSVTGYHASDTITISNTSISNLQISTVQNSTLPTIGILGLGYPSQSPLHTKHTSKPQTFLDILVKSNIIHHKAYSVALPSSSSSTGSIIFGGMDISQFHSPMVEVPIAPHTDAKGHKSYHALQVMMTSLESGGDRKMFVNYAAVLDPSVRISLVPEVVMGGLGEVIGNSLQGGEGIKVREMSVGRQKIQVVDCSIREGLVDKNVTFGFGGLEGTKIGVPLRDLLVEMPGCGEDDEPCGCYLAVAQSPLIKSSGNGTTELTVLGDAILRHAYVVFDLQNNVVAMAQRKFESKSGSVVEFGKGMKSLSGIVEAHGNVTTFKQEGPQSVGATISRSSGLISTLAFVASLFGWLGV